MITATIDTSGFNAGMAGLIQKLGLESKVVVKKEVGELMKLLVKLTPPKSPEATRRKIARDVYNKFEVAWHQPSWIIQDSNGIQWTRATKKFLYARAPKNNMTQETNLKKLRDVYYRFNKTGNRQILPFLHPRKVQKVSLNQKVEVNETQRSELIALMKKSVGRLKAGWLAAFFTGKIQLSGGSVPPKWVTRHNNPRFGGYCVDGLNAPGFPTFAIANTAAGIRGKKNNMDFVVSRAIAGRAKAMATNLKLYLAGKKKLADYAK